MRLQLFAATIAALAFAGSVSAQPILQPGQVPTYVMSAPETVGYKHNGHLATLTRGAVSQSTGNYFWSNCPNGQNCNNGSGSMAADIGFAFGPSKSFFSPCGPRVLPDCGGKAGAGCSKCRTPIYGRGPVGPFPHCTYDSYLNH